MTSLRVFTKYLFSGTTGSFISSSPSVTVTTSMNSNNSNSSSGHLSSPEPEGLSTNHVSRIDKWKAKHQAMLKMVAEEKDRNSPSSPGSLGGSETSKLVITLEKGVEEKYAAPQSAPRPSLNTALVV